MNWDDTQYLLALGREGTLRKAAASLYVDCSGQQILATVLEVNQ